MRAAKYPIYYVAFKNQYLLASTFLRFQEFYESPKFRHKIFTWEEYMDWYASATTGKFTYFESYAGFNIPSSALKPFYSGQFDPLTQKERRLLRLFQGIRGRFYIIASVRGQWDDIIHEVVHALFYACPKYRREVKQCLKRFKLSSFERCLAATPDYHSAVFEDEINAYILTGLSEEMEKIKNKSLIRQLKYELRKIFIKHFGRPMNKKSLRYFKSQIHQLTFPGH